MQTGDGGSSWRMRSGLPIGCRLGLCLCLLAGCAGQRQQVGRALMTDKGPATQSEGVTERYLVGCPDVLEVSVEGRVELSGRRRVGADGRIDLGPAGRPRVEGWTLSDIALAVAERAGVPPASVHVRVAEYHSQHIYLVGEVAGLQRAVPYQGPEKVGELLQRAGGITPGAAIRDVHVIRSHVADGRTPEVFRVDLRAIVMNEDQRTNLPLQPFDQIYVGQTRRSSLARCIPPVLRPVYEKLCGLRRQGAPGAPGVPGKATSKDVVTPAQSPVSAPRRPDPDTLPPPRQLSTE